MNIYDVIIVGTGVSGFHCALHLDSSLNVLILSKGSANENNTYLAQGGISTARDENDINLFVQDTLKSGQYHNNIQSVKTLVNESFNAIEYLLKIGMPLDKDKNSQINYTKEGAHSINRIVHVKDETGRYLWESLSKEIKKRKNITILEHSLLVDIIQESNTCYGCIIKNQESPFPETFFSKCLVLATGGIGGIFKNSTNQKILTGDSLAIALKNNISLKDLEFIQIHPTGLYDNNYYGRRFLISESLRGEGGILLNEKGNRFVNELLPRDIVTTAILKEINQSRLPYVFLDISFLEKDFILKRFPLIYRKCAQIGIDITKDPMLVIPSQHYHMGGIEVDLDSKTSMTNLYAVGETSCTGIHGKNRLASNSLLEGLVFSNRAAQSINRSIKSIKVKEITFDYKNFNYKNVHNKYKKILINEIQRRSPQFHDELFDY